MCYKVTKKIPHLQILWDFFLQLSDFNRITAFLLLAQEIRRISTTKTLILKKMQNNR